MQKQYSVGNTDSGNPHQVCFWLGTLASANKHINKKRPLHQLLLNIDKRPTLIHSHISLKATKHIWSLDTHH